MSERLCLRPKVAMAHYTCVPHVVALGLCDVRPDLLIFWPHNVCDATTYTTCLEIKARAGYDDEGMFCELTLAGPLEVTVAMREAVFARVRAWERALKARPRQAPLTPVLTDYAEAQAMMGHDVLITYPNGMPAFEGTFCGVDIWGRATVRTADGSEVEFGPERYHMLLASR